MSNQQLDPNPILQAAFAFWSSKVLLTAVEFGVFTKLGTRRLTDKARLWHEQNIPLRRRFCLLYDALVCAKRSSGRERA